MKTEFKKEKEARELEIYREWKELTAEPGSMATAVDDFLMKKYSIFSRATIWNIRNRVENRLKNA